MEASQTLDTTQTIMADFGFICSLPNLIVKIFRYLSLPDQLRLSRTSRQLGDVFREYVWPVDWSTLTIYERKKNAIVANGTGRDRCFLNRWALPEFLQFNAGEVKNLTIRNTTCVTTVSLQYALNEGYFVDKGLLKNCFFPNLTTLTYRFMKISPEHFDWIHTNCPRLEEFDISQSWCSVEDLLVRLGDLMPSLRRLRITKTVYKDMRFSTFEILIAKTKLECLHWPTFIQEPQTSEEVPSTVYLKELSLALPSISENWYLRNSYFLRVLESLTSLTLNFPLSTCNQAVFNMLLKCRSLQCLTISKAHFDDTLDIVLPPQLTELSLEECQRLSVQNFKRILEVTNLKSVSCDIDDLSADIQEIYIPKNIEKLEIGVSIYPIAFVACENLRELVVHNYVLFSEEARTPAPLQCDNLQVLTMKGLLFPLQTLQQLPSLQKLTMNNTSPRADWTYICEVLKLPSLKELVIHNAIYGMSATELIPKHGFATCLEALVISASCFTRALSFWLAIFDQSPHLKRLTCDLESCPDHMALKSLVTHKDFVRVVKTLHYCGFSFSSAKLKKDFVAIGSELGGYMSESQFWFDIDTYCMVLER